MNHTNSSPILKSKLAVLVALSSIVLVLGSTVVVGWVFGVDSLKSITPAWVTMKFSTAMSFVLSGIMLFAIIHFVQTKTEFSRAIIIIPSITVIFFTLLDVASGMFQFSSPLLLLFSSEDSGVGSLKKGLPSVGTMVNFLLIGVCGLLFNFNFRIQKIFQIVGFVVLLIGVIGMSGYGLDQPYLYYQIESVSGAMAIHTTILFYLVGAFLLFLSKVGDLQIKLDSFKKLEFLRWAFFLISMGGILLLFNFILGESLQHEDFWRLMIYLASIFVIISAILILYRLKANYDRMDLEILHRKNAEKKSLRALEKLRQYEIEKEEFSSMISHELKTPLTPIRGYCEIILGMLKDKKEDQEVIDCINKIDFNASLLENFISDLLDAQKLDMKKMNFSYADVCYDDFLNDLKKDYEQKIKSKKIKFWITNRVNDTHNTDPTRLRQILDNLLNNSIDFVPDTGGEINLSVKDDSDKILFCVKDNGVGIPKNKHSKLFKKFFQADTSLARKHGGTGLGLVICKGLVEGLKGRIWFESEFGKGSQFYFSLPKED